MRFSKPWNFDGLSMNPPLHFDSVFVTTSGRDGLIDLSLIGSVRELAADGIVANGMSWAWGVLAMAGNPTGDAAGGQAKPSGPLEYVLGNPLIFMMLAMALFYLMVIRPQQKAARQQQDTLAEALKNLKKNDRVITTAGIHASVANVQADAGTVTLKIDESTNATLTVSREAIAKVVTPKAKEGT